MCTVLWFLGTQWTVWADLTLAECTRIGLEYVGPREKSCLYRSTTDVSGIRMNMAPNGVWLFEWFVNTNSQFMRLSVDLVAAHTESSKAQ